VASSKQNLTLSDVQKAKEAAAAASDEVISKSLLDTVLNANPEDLITADPDPEVLKGSARRSGGWVHSPGHLEMFAAAHRRLVRVSNEQGIPGNHIGQVQAFIIPGTRILIIKGAHKNDLTAIPVSRYKGSSGAWINLFHLLAKVGLTVDTGYKEQYDIAYIPKASRLAPGLMIDLSDRKDRQLEPVPKDPKAKKQTPPQPNTPPTGTTAQQAASPAQEPTAAKAGPTAPEPNAEPAMTAPQEPQK
jgi:hypothetical protein